MGSFSDSIRRFSVRKKAEHDAVVRKVVFDLSYRVLKSSPVDTGRFRANWQYGYGVQPMGELNTTDLSQGGSATHQNIVGQITKGKGIHYLVNNLPYAEVIEYGRFPNPPEKGTYVKGGQTKYGITGPGYVQRSEGGFSKQAPAGVARLALEEVSNDLRRIADEVKV